MAIFAKSEFRSGEHEYKNRIRNDIKTLKFMGCDEVKSGFRYLYARLVSLLYLSQFYQSLACDRELF